MQWHLHHHLARLCVGSTLSSKFWLRYHYCSNLQALHQTHTIIPQDRRRNPLSSYLKMFSHSSQLHHLIPRPPIHQNPSKTAEGYGFLNPCFRLDNSTVLPSESYLSKCKYHSCFVHCNFEKRGLDQHDVCLAAWKLFCELLTFQKVNTAASLSGCDFCTIGNTDLFMNLAHLRSHTGASIQNRLWSYFTQK